MTAPRTIRIPKREQAKLNVLRPAPRYAPPMGLREPAGLVVEYA